MSTQVSTDGTTVWVNSDKGCVGRYTKRLSEVMKDTDTGEWGLFQNQLATSEDDGWTWFKRMVLAKHGVTVSDDVRPK